jgi:predicted dehydrogenase
VALVGAGWVSLHRHLPSLREQQDVQVVGLVERNPDRAVNAARKCRVPRWSASSSLREVSWIDEVDAVVIGTPPATHGKLAAEALSLGLNVLTEKPFTLTVGEGVRLCQRSEETRKTLAVIHNFQFSRSFLRLRADLETGRLGELRAVEAYQLSSPRRRLPTWYEELPGGLFLDESPHLIYLLRALLGAGMRLTSAAAAVARAGTRTPDLLTAFFEGEGRAHARMTLNFVAPVSEWFVTALGSEALGIADVFRNVYVRLPSDGLHVTPTVLRTSGLATLRHWLGQIRPGAEFLLGRAMYGNDEVMRRFASACRSGTEPAEVSSADGLAVVRMQHAILSAAGID